MLALITASPLAYLAGIPSLLWSGAVAGCCLTILALYLGAERVSARVDVEQLIHHVRPGRKISILDPQTALLQRWYFELRVAEEAERCKRHGFRTAVLFMLLDLPPESVTSHETPEDRAAQLFVHSIRKGDLAAKIAPNTYGLCLPHSDSSQARAAIRRLLSSLPKDRITDVSIAMCPTDGSDISTLLTAAQPVDLNEPIAILSRRPGVSQAIGKMLSEYQSGEIEVRSQETLSQAKARARRAAKRAGVSIRLWDKDGILYYQREEAAERTEAIAG